MTLTIQDLGALGEFLGSIAVLVTLGYLALQTRQNTIAIGAQLDAAAIGANQNSLLTTAQSSDLIAAIAEDIRADMTPSQIRLGLYWASLLSSFQWQLQQSRRGLLPSFKAESAAANVQFFFSTSGGFHAWWDAAKPTFPSDFIAWVEEQRAKAA